MAFKTVGLSTAVWNNNLRSLFLLCFYPLLLTGMVWAICYLIGASLMPQPAGAAFDFTRPAVYASHTRGLEESGVAQASKVMADRAETMPFGRSR